MQKVRARVPTERACSPRNPQQSARCNTTGTCVESRRPVVVGEQGVSNTTVTYGPHIFPALQDRPDTDQH